MLHKCLFSFLLLHICCCENQAFAQSNDEQKKEKIIHLFKKRVYLITGMNFNKQTITLNDYSSRFNYELNDYQKNLYKPAYFLGIRWESKAIHSHKFAFTAMLSKISTGNNYVDANKLPPFVTNYSKFLAEDQFLMLNLSAYYKQLIPISDTSRYKLYFTIGPSLNTRLSEQSPDNLINHNYRRHYISGDGGLEFNNQSFYTLFLHYKLPLSSFTKEPIHSNLNSIQMGAMVKLNDIF
jgi:hypothetical protein